jgi:hypothetical protein
MNSEFHNDLSTIRSKTFEIALFGDRSVRLENPPKQILTRRSLFYILSVSFLMKRSNLKN